MSTIETASPSKAQQFAEHYVHALIARQIALDFTQWLKLTTALIHPKTCALIAIPREVVRRLKAGEIV